MAMKCSQCGGEIAPGRLSSSRRISWNYDSESWLRKLFDTHSVDNNSEIFPWWKMNSDPIGWHCIPCKMIILHNILIK